MLKFNKNIKLNSTKSIYVLFCKTRLQNDTLRFLNSKHEVRKLISPFVSVHLFVVTSK